MAYSALAWTRTRAAPTTLAGDDRLAADDERGGVPVGLDDLDVRHAGHISSVRGSLGAASTARTGASTVRGGDLRLECSQAVCLT